MGNGGPTFGSTVDHRFERFGHFWIDEIDESSAHPSSRVDGIESADDHGELHVVRIVFVLNFAEIT